MTGIRDLWVGRLGLPTVGSPVTESLGSEVATVGESTAVGQRRAKGFTLVFPIHGTPGDANLTATGNRMRRQLRGLIQNHPLRLAAVYIKFPFDAERNGWLVIGQGELADANGGVPFGEYQLTLSQAFLVASLTTHREGFRVDLTDRRLSTTPIDYYGEQIGTAIGFAGLTALAVTPLPAGAYDALRQGAVPKLISRASTDGSVPIALATPTGYVISWERAESDFNKSDVVILDRQNNRLGATLLTFTPAGAAINKPNSCNCCTTDANGNFLLGGEVYFSGANGSVAVTRLTPTGTIDTTFGQNGWWLWDTGSPTAIIQGIAVDSLGRIVVAITAGHLAACARILPNGQSDSTFGTAGVIQFSPASLPYAAAYGVAVQSDGKIVVSGTALAGNANLVPNPSFEYDTIGAAPAAWSGPVVTGTLTLTTYAVQSGWSLSGSQSLRVTATGVTPYSGLYGKSSRQAITATLAYSAQATFNVLSSNTLIQLALTFYDGSGTVTGQQIPYVFSSPGVQSVTVSNLVAPAGSVTAELTWYAFNTGGSAAPVDCYLDSFILAQGSLPAYFDGDSPGYGWSGAPGNSITQGVISAFTTRLTSLGVIDASYGSAGTTLLRPTPAGATFAGSAAWGIALDSSDNAYLAEQTTAAYNTIVASFAASGQNLVYLTSSAGLLVGNQVVIGSGATADTATIAVVNSATEITTVAPLVHGHNVGEPVRGTAAVFCAQKLTSAGAVSWTNATVIGAGDASFAVAVQPGTNLPVVAGGNFGGGGVQIVVARYTATGAFDATFASGGIAQGFTNPAGGIAQAVACDAAGRIYTADAQNGTVGRLTPSGQLDTSFAIGGYLGNPPSGPWLGENGVAVNSSGEVTVVGTGQNYVWAAVQLSSNGTPLVPPGQLPPWEEVYGPDHPLTAGDVPVLQNGLCRVRYDASTAVLPGLVVDVFNPTTGGYQTQGKFTFQRAGDVGGLLDTLRRAAVLEWTPDRAVIEVTLAVNADAYSHERILVTLQRGWSGPRIEGYTSPRSDGTASSITLRYSLLPGAANATAMKIDAVGAAVVATAGTGTGGQWPGTAVALGAITFTGENEVAVVQEGAGWQTHFAALQAGAEVAVLNTGEAFGPAANVLELSTALPYASWQIGFIAQNQHQTIEAETIRNAGSGTTSIVADTAASGGSAVKDTQATAAAATLTSGFALPSGKYRVIVRARVDASGSGSFQLSGSAVTATTTSTTYVWLDLGDWPYSGGVVSLLGWGTGVYVDRVEAFLLEDRTGSTPGYLGARDLGQIVLYDQRVNRRLISRG